MAFLNKAVTKNKECDLCNQVVKKLGQENLSEPLKNKLIQVNEELRESTFQYFKYQLIVNCVKKFLDRRVTQKVTNKEHSILSDPFYLNFVKKYASVDGIQTFGVTEDFIDKTIKRHTKTQAEKEEINKFVEDEIDNFCNNISEYAGFAQRYRSNQQRAFQEAVKDLTSQIDELAVAEYKLESEEKDVNDLLSNYFENLVEGVSILGNLVSLREETIKFQSSLRKLYESRQSALASKINRFEHQILVATYHEKSVEALTRIREELDQKKAVIDNNLNSTNSELQTYNALGPQYEELVDEYSELMRRILHQKLTIESLKRRQSFGGSLSDKGDLISNIESDEEETSCSHLGEISSYSHVGEISSCSIVDETLDCSTLVEVDDISRLDETVDNSKLN